ncbi:unnamed protein product [Brachionus calyciflorus]|uniref:Apple domain-containing protein n=1 Tax=Brachionus calyciflorus TaxID=104777 RepID=A0A813V5B1_9BILA|nr:unnamed protein product [Brachionus calyciflorus]
MIRASLVLISIALFGMCYGQQCSFESNVDYFGNDLSTVPCPVKSLEECCNLCSKVKECAAWTYIPTTGYCWLKHSVTERRVMVDGRYSGCRQTAVTNAPCPCKETKDVNYPGCDLKEQAGILKSDDCCKLCRETPNCVAFAYLAEFQYCYLKSAANSGTPQSYPGIIYGTL